MRACQLIGQFIAPILKEAMAIPRWESVADSFRWRFPLIALLSEARRNTQTSYGKAGAMQRRKGWSS